MKTEKIIAVGILLFGFGFFLGIVATHYWYEKTIVEHNCAQYNSQTGDFEWK